MNSLDTDALSVLDDAQGINTPERRLLLAILERAILDFVGNDLREVESATEWICADLNRQKEDRLANPFSFRWVCEELDLDPTRVAAFIRSIPKRGERRVAPWYFMNRDEVDAAADQLVKLSAAVGF